MVSLSHILTTTKSYHNKILLSMNSKTYIYVYGRKITAVSTKTRQWAGQRRISDQWLAGARALVQSIQTRSRIGTCPASYKVVIRSFSPGKEISEHEAVCSPPPPPHPKAELYHNTSHAFMACRQSFTPY